MAMVTPVHRRTPLLERGSEMRSLADVVATRCGIALVEGPAGIGKSSLLWDACSVAGDEPLVLVARGSELESALAFGVVRQLFEEHVAALADDERTSLFSGVGALAAGVIDPQHELLDDGTDRSVAVTHALSWVLFRLASRRPLVLAVDDVQWADDASRRFLSYVAQRLDGHDVVMLLTQRTGEPAGDLLAAVRARADVLLRPPLLTLEAVRDIIVRRLGEAWSHAAEPCHRATDGNPLYVHHLVRRLSDVPGRPTPMSDEEVLALGAVALEADVDARLERSGPESRRLATALAALGDRRRLAEVARVAGLDLACAAAARDALAAHGIVSASEPVSFPHPVVRAAVARLLPAGAHRDVARALADDGVDVDVVAAHVAREQPSADAWTVEVLREAARRAVAHGAPDVGVTLLERALQEPPPAPVLPDVLAEAGEAAAWVGRADAPELLRRARDATTDRRTRARRALALARALSGRNRNADAADVLLAAENELGEAEPDLLASLRTELVVVGLQDVRLVLQTLPAVAALAEAPEDAVAREVLGLVEANAIGMGGGSQQQVLDRLLAAPPAPDVTAVGWEIRSFTAFSLLSTGGYAEAHRMFAEAADHGRRRGAARAQLLAASGWQTSAWLRGDLGTAVREGRQALEMCLAMNAPDAAVVVSGVLSMSLLDAGDPAEAAAVIDAAPEPEEHPHLMTCLLYSAMCRRHLADGDSAAAVEVMRRADARYASLLPVSVPSPGMWSWRSPLVEALLTSGEVTAARAEADHELQQARAWGGSRALGIALRDAALVCPDRARALLDEAVSTLRPSEHRLELARSLAARWRQGAGDACRDEALSLARTCGARSLVAELEGAPACTGPAARLTRGEGAVAALAAEGLTNAEVAARLHLSQATVKTHLLRVFDKLGVRNRTELARIWDADA